jgi:hypothetical protein
VIRINRGASVNGTLHAIPAGPRFIAPVLPCFRTSPELSHSSVSGPIQTDVV